MSRDVRQEGGKGRKVREARLRRVSSEFRLRPLVYEISDISGRSSEISNGTEHLPRDPTASSSTRLKYVRHERGCNIRHFAHPTIATLKRKYLTHKWICIIIDPSYYIHKAVQLCVITDLSSYPLRIVYVMNYSDYYRLDRNYR